ncbi:MAG: Trk system potassium transporter TrkA [Lachnospiraceae bacterium]|jgi:trk system potassium uptake protein TrkA|nr:Trk system potassium transporter TrkA [Lachnospiraceae bacterium]
MKIIIVGCGKVGMTLAAELNKDGHDITVIDKNPYAVTATTNNVDVLGLVGNGAVYNVQIEAGVAGADLLIACTDSDELNMLCCLIAKKAGDARTIARIRDPEYSSEIRYIRDELNLSMAINPEQAAAGEIAQLLRFPSAIKIDTFTRGRVEIMKFIVPEGSVLNDMRVQEVFSRLGRKVLICALERGEDVLIPSGPTFMRAGDKLSVLAQPGESMEFFRQVGIENNAVKTVLMVGGGKITYYLAKMLEETHIKIKIIEENADRCNFLSDALPKAMIIHGDGSSQELLLEEGIRQVEAFAALTGFDEENIMLSLYAATQSKAKLITKVNRIAFDNVVNALKLGSVIHPKRICADMILQYVRAMQNASGSNVKTLYKLTDNGGEALEFNVGKDFPGAGIPLEKLRLKNNLLVASINRKGKIITPSGKDTIEEGDTAIIVTTNAGLLDLKDILA